jgi:formate hydrogenlyase transcriptional activator
LAQSVRIVRIVCTETIDERVDVMSEMAEFPVDELRATEEVISPDGEAERALIAAIRALSLELSVDGACGAALDAVEQMFGARSSWILLQDPSTRCLRMAARRGVGSEAYEDVSIPLDHPAISALVCSERKVVFVPDVGAELRWFDAGRMHQSGLSSLFMVPLLFRQRAVGVLALHAPRFTETTPPQLIDIERLQALATQIAIAFTNARLFEASEQDRQRLRALLREHRQLSGQISHLERKIWDSSAGGLIVGESAAILETMNQADLVARADTTVLVLGETGSGKDLLARLIHQRSRRASGPFIAVNCAALPEHLVESELFGHERGAFTGAIARKAGSFEIAHRGTIFLDEIGDLPPEAQAKLLRVLQDREVQRIGGARPIAVDVRVVAATNHDLEKAIAAGTFRTDLFYRLSVFPIRTPALRERRDDIPLLARHFLRHFARKLGRPLEDFSGDALERLRSYAWPGNVRELQNVIERAAILSQGPVIETDALSLPDDPPTPSGFGDEAAMSSERVPRAAAAPSRTSQAIDELATLADAERRAILNALNATSWRISGHGGAAERLAMKPTTLHAKMKKLGIRRPSPYVPATPA